MSRIWVVRLELNGPVLGIAATLAVLVAVSGTGLSAAILAFPSIIPSFRLGKQVAESARLRDGLGEGCDERCEPMLGHVGDQFI